MSRIVWLASYPKSGNTWFRLLIANLGAEVPADINALPDQGGIASARTWFDNLMLFPSGLLTHEECDRLRPALPEAMAGGDADQGLGDLRAIKTHDAWTYTQDGLPLLGRGSNDDRAILIVRDPRDVAPSLANHGGNTVDQSIAFMADGEAAFCGRIDRQHNQLRQQLPSWSGFNSSWLEQAEVPVHLVRYEDLHADTAAVFSRALAFAGVAVSSEQVERAVEFASFGTLQAQELRNGFREAPPGRGGRFFRQGQAEAWRRDLSAAQIARIEGNHAEMMNRLGYVPAHAEIAATA